MIRLKVLMLLVWGLSSPLLGEPVDALKKLKRVEIVELIEVLSETKDIRNGDAPAVFREIIDYTKTVNLILVIILPIITICCFSYLYLYVTEKLSKYDEHVTGALCFVCLAMGVVHLLPLFIVVIPELLMAYNAPRLLIGEILRSLL